MTRTYHTIAVILLTVRSSFGSSQLDDALALLTPEKQFFDIAPLSTKDPLSFVPAGSQLGVIQETPRSQSIAELRRADAERASLSRSGGDPGQVFLKSFIRTDAHRETVELAVSYMSLTWFILAGVILTYLLNLAFLPRLKAFLNRSSVVDESSDEDEDEEEVSPIKIKKSSAPKALLPSSADARIAYETQAYSAS